MSALPSILSHLIGLALIRCTDWLCIVNLISQLLQWLKKQPPRLVGDGMCVLKCRIVWMNVIVANALIILPCNFNALSAFGDSRREIEYRGLDAALRRDNNVRQVSACENVQSNLVNGGKRSHLGLTLRRFSLRTETEIIADDRSDNPAAGSQSKQPKGKGWYLIPHILLGIFVIASWAYPIAIGWLLAQMHNAQHQR